MPLATIRESHRIGAPCCSAVVAAVAAPGTEGEFVEEVDLAAGVDHPDCDRPEVFRPRSRSASAAMVANDCR